MTPNPHRPPSPTQPDHTATAAGEAMRNSGQRGKVPRRPVDSRSVLVMVCTSANEREVSAGQALAGGGWDGRRVAACPAPLSGNEQPAYQRHGGGPGRSHDRGGRQQQGDDGHAVAAFAVAAAVTALTASRTACWYSGGEQLGADRLMCRP